MMSGLSLTPSLGSAFLCVDSILCDASSRMRESPAELQTHILSSQQLQWKRELLSFLCSGRSLGWALIGTLQVTWPSLNQSLRWKGCTMLWLAGPGLMLLSGTRVRISSTWIKWTKPGGEVVLQEKLRYHYQNRGNEWVLGKWIPSVQSTRK